MKVRYCIRFTAQNTKEKKGISEIHIFLIFFPSYKANINIDLNKKFTYVNTDPWDFKARGLQE